MTRRRRPRGRRRLRLGRVNAVALATLVAGILTLASAFSASNTVAASSAGQNTSVPIPENFDPPECDGATGVNITAIWQVGTARSTAGLNELVLGTLGADNANGLAGSDCMVGGGGNDTLDAGGAGAIDVLVGGDGTDTLTGGNGNDYLYGGSGNDTLNGGAGGDFLYGGGDDDTLNGDNGNDFLNGGTGIDVCNGGPGADTFDASCETQNQ